MYELYSWLALVLSISFFAVAVTMTILMTDRLIDIAFTIREWLLGALFLMTFLVTHGPADNTYDVFHGQLAEFRAAFMVVVAAASATAVYALLYTFHNRNKSL